jgi:hypothetical protein
MTNMVMVYDAQNDRSLLVTEAEARTGMLRYAQSLTPGSAERASVEDHAINGEMPSWPPTQAVA